MEASILLVFCLFFPYCFSQETPCTETMSIDITNGTNSSDTFIWDKVEFKKGEYYEDEGKIRGCICKKKKCIRTCQDDSDYNITIPIYNGSNQIGFVDTEYYHFVIDYQCPSESDGAFFVDEKKEYFVQEDGSVFDSENNVFYPMEKYCLDSGKVYVICGIPPIPPSVVKDPTYELTLVILNNKTVKGLENKFDSDGIVDIGNGQEDQHETTENEREFIIEKQYDDSNKISCDENGPGNSYLEINNEEIHEDSTEETSHDWTTYTAEQLQTPKSIQLQSGNSSNKKWTKRRRPQICNTSNIALKYEEVAAIKKCVMQEQLEVLKFQNSEMQEKAEWDRRQRKRLEKQEIEEFELKKKAAQLDIQIKQAQLNALNNIH